MSTQDVMRLTDRVLAVWREAADMPAAEEISLASWAALRDAAYDVVRVANKKLGVT